MDSAGADPLRSAVTQQGILLGQHASQLTSTSREVEFLNAKLSELTAQLQELRRQTSARSEDPTSLSSTRHDPEPHANNPPPYDGNPNSCRAFLSQCSLVFALQPRRYAQEETKVAYVLTLLTGRARDWGTSVWEARAPFCASFGAFRQEMVKLFDRSARGDEAAAQLARLQQGGRSVTEYAIEFKTLAAACDWNEGACRAVFRAGLDEEIQDKIATQELPRSFDDLVDLALRVENRLRLRHQQLTARTSWRVGEMTSESTPVLPLPSPADPEPMQVGRLRLTSQQKQERLTRGLCLYCGRAGHFVGKCPLKAKAHQ